MTTIALTTRQQFDRNMDFFARDLTTREFTGASVWAITDLIHSYDISELTLEFLQNELKLRKSHFFLDAHNWSDFHRATSDNTIQIIEGLCMRKEEVGA